MTPPQIRRVVLGHLEVQAFRENALKATDAISEAYLTLCLPDIKEAVRDVLMLMTLNKGQGNSTKTSEIVRALSAHEALDPEANYLIGVVERSTLQVYKPNEVPDLDNRSDEFIRLTVNSSSKGTLAHYEHETLWSGGVERTVVVNLLTEVLEMLKQFLSKTKTTNTNAMVLLPKFMFNFVSYFKSTMAHELTHYEQDITGDLNKTTERSEKHRSTNKHYRLKDFEVEPEADRSSLAMYFTGLLDKGAHSPEFINDNVSASRDLISRWFYDRHSQTPEDLSDVVETGKKLEKDGLMTKKLAEYFKWYIPSVVRRRGQGDPLRGPDREKLPPKNPKGDLGAYLAAVGDWVPTPTFLEGRFLQYWKAKQ